MSRRNLVFLISIWLLLIAAATVIEGHGRSGDSILHYLFARYAFIHPSNYFHHWAKPLFTLIASPFAQIGLIGLKLMNVSFAVASSYLLFGIGEHLKIRRPYLLSIMLFFIPVYTVLLFSGLTEPMFAFFLVLMVYLTLRKQALAATLIVSFLPFIRSEGLIIIGVYFALLLLRKRFKLLPLLGAGHLAYGIAGYWKFKTILWPLTKIPYNNYENYGSGEPFDFIKKLLYIMGVPLYILFWFGIIALGYALWKNRVVIYEEIVLIYGLIVVYVAAHSIFWWQGLFHSMGLNRVLIAIAPLLAIVCVRGFLFIQELVVNSALKKTISLGIITYIIIFPFTSNKAAVKLEQLERTEVEVILDSLALRTNWYKNVPKFYHAPYVSVGLEVDHFDRKMHPVDWSLINDSAYVGSLVIWDSWFSTVEAGIQLSVLQEDDRLTEIERYNSDRTEEPLLVLFEVKPK